MNAEATAAPHGLTPRLSLIVCFALLAIATGAAYRNSFGTPFVFDAGLSIVENPTIRQLWPIWPVLDPDLPGATVEGRPLLNLSFALNYACGGLNPWSYHLANLIIHLGAGLLLFGIVRQTLALPRFAAQRGVGSDAIPFVAALLWLLHPLQTESVVNVVQRAESLAGLFYFLTLHLSIRAMTASRPTAWTAGACMACLAGMASKEILVSAPLIVLLYDRTLVAGSFGEAFRARARLHGGLMTTWLLLAVLVIRSGNHGNTVGFDHGISSWNYALTQFPAIVHYLRLSFWPAPLILDYGEASENLVSFSAALPAMLLVVALCSATAVALRRRVAAGLLGAFFFLVLAPSSSVVPIIAQTIAEHRMYLPLAVVTTGAAFLLHRLHRHAPVAVGIMVGALFIAITDGRCRDYRSSTVLARDTVIKRPLNSRAHYTLGNAITLDGDPVAAIPHYLRSLELNPRRVLAYNNLGLALASQGKLDEAIQRYHEALGGDRRSALVWNNLGQALLKQGKDAEAIDSFQQAVRWRPDFADAHSRLGYALAAQGRVEEAIEHDRRALAANPDLAETHNNLGILLAGKGQIEEAIEHFHRALAQRPDFDKACNNLANALLSQANFDGAIAQYEQVLARDPRYAAAHGNLALALSKSGRTAEAIAHYRLALDLKPDAAWLHHDYGELLLQLGRRNDASVEFRRTLEIEPGHAEAAKNLAQALSSGQEQAR